MSIENILNVYNLATEQEKKAGLAWYKEARAFCKAQAKEYGVSLEVVVAVISALSPRNKWEQNLAVRQGKGPNDVKVCTFGKNKQKAFDIVLKHRPSLVKESNKTRSFFDNIRFENSQEVTIDIHAFNIYVGLKIPARSFTDKQYSEMVEAYREAAKHAKIKAYELQAVCWVAWKRLLKDGKQLTLAID
jgi:hypothetical protein